ncbi:MAG TPA: hypothetical protein PKH33_07885 [bacterium]|nr:hypothetical protein [bacterium]
MMFASDRMRSNSRFTTMPSNQSRFRFTLSRFPMNRSLPEQMYCEYE